MSAGSIVIELLMRTGAFETDTKRAERRLKELDREFRKVGKAIGTALVAGGTLAVGTLTAMVLKGREVIDSQAKLAQQLNTTFESIETLARAGELAGVSLQQIAAVGRQLEVNLARGALGTGAQAEALDRLGLSAEDLIRLPLDQKIATINAALDANVDASQRAAAAADLFGAEGGAALSLIDAATIAEAARQTQLFGLNLSDVDAAQVEQANDALSTFTLASKGASVQLTRELAPILKGIGDEFLTVIENAGGFEDVSVRVVQTTVSGFGLVSDAIAGVGRVITVTADAAIIFLNSTIAGISALAQAVLRFADRVPGVDTSGLQADLERFGGTAEAVVGLAWDNINETLLEPLPSGAIEAWAEQVKVSARESAEAAVAARGNIDEALAGGSTPTIEFDAPASDLALFEELEEGFKSASALVTSTRTEVERLEAQIASAQELAAAGFFVDGRDSEVLARLNERLEEARARASQDTEGQVEELNQFAVQAMRNTQDIIANGLRNGFEEGFSGIAASFANLLLDLTSQFLASQLATFLFGPAAGGGGGGLGGLVGGLFGGGRAVGGSVSAGTTYRINEREPEFFTPSTSGVVVPLSRMGGAAGGVNITQNLTVNGASRTEMAAAAAVISQQTEARVIDTLRRAGRL